MNFGKWMYELRVGVGLSQSQVAHSLGVQCQCISHIERSVRHTPVKYLRKIFDLYKPQKEEFIESYLKDRTEKYRNQIIKEIEAAWKA